MINYSIIIPHKNTPDLLQKCIDSIPHRDDVQIIVVDDHSDDDKVDFEHFPGVGEPNIEVYFMKEGKGAGYARNIGLKHSVGKWLIFADADDFFNPCINDIFDQCVNMSENIAFFKADSINLIDGSNGHRADGLNIRIDIALKISNFQPALFYSSPWCKLFKHDFLEKNDITFNEVRYGNDIVFMAKVAVYSKNCRAIDKVAYCITCSKNSKSESRESVEIRLSQDIKAAGILKRKFTFSRRDKYWFFFSWNNLYKIDKQKAIKYWFRMFSLFGMIFLYDTCLMLFKNTRHSIKNKLIKK